MNNMPGVKKIASQMANDKIAVVFRDGLPLANDRLTLVAADFQTETQGTIV